MPDKDRKDDVGKSVDKGSSVVLASITWDNFIKIVNRHLPHHSKVPTDIRKFSSEKEAEEAVKKTWKQQGRDFLITKWVPTDATQTVVVIGSAAIIAATVATILKNRKKWTKKIPPQREKK